MRYFAIILGAQVRASFLLCWISQLRQGLHSAAVILPALVASKQPPTAFQLTGVAGLHGRLGHPHAIFMSQGIICSDFFPQPLKTIKAMNSFQSHTKPDGRPGLAKELCTLAGVAAVAIGGRTSKVCPE